MNLETRVERLAQKIGERRPDAPDPMEALGEALGDFSENGDWPAFMEAVEAYCDATAVNGFRQSPECVITGLEYLMALASSDEEATP